MKNKKAYKKLQQNREYIRPATYEKIIQEPWLEELYEEEKKRNKKEITSILAELRKLGLTDEIIDNLIVSNVFARQKEQYYSRYLDFKTIVAFLVLFAIQ